MEAKGEVPQTEWPLMQIGKQSLVVRWTFYAQWLLSKRKVDVRGLGEMIARKDPGLADVILECFAAAVAENYEDVEAPNAERWARIISAQPDQAATWQRVNGAVWEAVKKARLSETPAPAETAEKTGATLQ